MINPIITKTNPNIKKNVWRISPGFIDIKYDITAIRINPENI